MEHMYGLQGIVEGFESAHTARAELQLDNAGNRQGESVVAELAFGIHIHNTFDSLPFIARLAGTFQNDIQSGHFTLSFPFRIQILDVQTPKFSKIFSRCTRAQDMQCCDFI